MITQSTSYNICIAANSTNYITFYQLANFIPQQFYQLIPSLRIYQYTGKKKIYKIDNQKFGNYPEDFHIIFEQDAKEIQYLDEAFDKIY